MVLIISLLLPRGEKERAAFEDGTELAIADSTFAELTAKPLKNDKTDRPAYLCAYRRYLEIMKEHDMICFIELKGTFPDGKVKEVFELAEKVYRLDRCILQSFVIENLIEARRLFPKLPVMLTYGTAQRGWERCFEYGFSIDADWKVVTPEMVSAFHERSLEVGLWTANTDDALAFCRSMDVDYIESDVYGG